MEPAAVGTDSLSLNIPTEYQMLQNLWNMAYENEALGEFGFLLETSY